MLTGSPSSTVATRLSAPSASGEVTLVAQNSSMAAAVSASDSAVVGRLTKQLARSS